VNALVTDDAAVAAKEIAELAPDLIETLDRSVPMALRGREAATKAYVGAWGDLTGRLLALAHRSMPDLVVETDQGDLMLVDVKHAPSPAGRTQLEYMAVNAPFSPWVNRFGPGRGVAVFLLSAVREAIPGLHPLLLGDDESGLPGWEIDPSDFSRFARRVWLELRREEGPLERAGHTFDLTATDLGGLFGVSRQAIGQWEEQGIPPSRQPKALAVARIADLLERNLEPGRIPAIARTPAEAYQGRSMLEMIAEDRHEELLAHVSESFDWAAPA
jgi:hypothetical protein